MFRAYKYRLYPNKSEIKNIDSQLIHACVLYNSALEERKEGYRIARKTITYFHQSAQIKELRKEGLIKLSNYSCCGYILRRIDKTYKAFYRRIKSKQKSGFPRYKSFKQFNTLTFTYSDGCKLKGKKIYLQGIGNVNIRLHRPIEGRIKTVEITRKHGRYYVAFCCEIEPAHLEKTGKSIGLDVGIENFVVTSEGEAIPNPRWRENSEAKIRIMKRRITRKKKGSKNRKIAVRVYGRECEKIANRRRNFFHKVANNIIKNNDIICIEELNIRGMANGILSKYINDASWGIFFSYLSYKAEYAGRKLIKVNPNGTSQRCHKCGASVKKNLNNRWHTCSNCGENCHRDFNSALEILRLGTDPDALTYSNRKGVALKAVI